MFVFTYVSIIYKASQQAWEHLKHFVTQHANRYFKYEVNIVSTERSQKISGHSRLHCPLAKICPPGLSTFSQTHLSFGVSSQALQKVAGNDKHGAHEDRKND